MSRRAVVGVTVALVAATVLPLALAVALVPDRGGTGVVTGTIWVANEASDSLTAIDADTHAVVTVVRGIAGPHNVQVSPDAKTVWATSPPRGLVAVVDAEALELDAIVPTGAFPAHVVLTPDGRRALVTNAEDDSLTIIDVRRHEVIGEVATDSYPHGLRPSPDGRTVLLANLGGSTVTLVDVRAATPVASIPVGRGPVQVGFSPDGAFAYATVNGEDEVVKIDLAARRVVARAPVAPGPVQLVVTPDGRTVLVASQGVEERPQDALSFVDASTMRLTGILSTGAGAHGVAVEPSGRQAFVTDVWAGDVAVIDITAQTVVDRIPVDGEPNGVSFSPVRQPHARGAANMNSPLKRVLPLGGRTDGTGSGGQHDHG